MDRDVYFDESDFYNQTKLDQVKLLCYYNRAKSEIDLFTIDDVDSWFQNLSLPRPNKSRLLKKIRKSNDFLKDGAEKSFRLHAKTVSELNDSFEELQEPSDEIVTYDTILPKTLYQGTRGYIARLAKQINASI